VKQRGFRRIQVLGLALIDDAAAEAQHPAARIADRKHQAVAKAIVEAGTCPAAARIALDDQAHLQQAAPLLLRGAEAIEQGVPGVGRVAQANFGAVAASMPRLIE
jgi:uncharacterized membrane-anchored protein